MTERVDLDGLVVDIRRSERRKTLGITIDRDHSVYAVAPPHASLRDIEDFVVSRADWIFEKLEARRRDGPDLPERRYVPGEGFPFLGRHYRLLLTDTQTVPLKLDRDRFMLLRSERLRGRAHFIDWYSARAQPFLEKRAARYIPRMGVSPADISVRDLGYRWGMWTPEDRVRFHWACILLPTRVIDYLVVHELAHFAEAAHTGEFWRVVERVLPDQASRRAWLAANASRYAL
ncbi:MAG: M48 family metallopeptidase [Acidobacteria bacterium]|nr:M48 family metallopeptidase [Acidobacteriota bacterium]